MFRGVGRHKQCFVEKFQLDRRVGLVQRITLLCRQLVLEESLRSVCPFVSVCCCSVRIFTSKQNAPSLQPPRAETRLTVYRALRSFGGKRGLHLTRKVVGSKSNSAAECFC